MVQVNFISHAGVETSVDGAAGDDVMRLAIQKNVAGIIGDCGGSLACATCHVHVAAEWRERVGPPSSLETEMLECAIEADESSRLSCQIILRDDLDGLVLHLPSTQL